MQRRLFLATGASAAAALAAPDAIFNSSMLPPRGERLVKA